jgi:hypothetical protein
MKIECIDAKVINITIEVIPGKVIFQGRLHFQIFFVNPRNIVEHKPFETEFSGFIDIPGAAPGIDTDVTGIIENILSKFIGNTLLLNTVLSVNVKVTIREQVSLNTAAGSVLSDVKRIIGQENREILIENMVEL